MARMKYEYVTTDITGKEWRATTDRVVVADTDDRDKLAMAYVGKYGWPDPREWSASGAPGKQVTAVKIGENVYQLWSSSSAGGVWGPVFAVISPEEAEKRK
jgi:hypothetical protein